MYILMNSAHMKIPVYSGATRPMVHAWSIPGEPFHGYDGFGDADLPSLSPSPPPLQQQHAIWALVDYVKKYPG